MIRLSTSAVAFASLILAGSAFAQTAPAPAPSAKPVTQMAPKGKATEAPRTAASLECSKEGDAKNVHGKERQKFMSSCKKDAKAKAN